MRSAAMRISGLTVMGIAALSAQLPPDIQADRYLVRAERQIEQQDYSAAKESMDRILRLQQEHGLEVPEEFFFRYAEVVERLGLYDEAIVSVTKYLTLVGRSGNHYREALELLDKAEAAAEVARRRPGESSVFDGIEFVWVPSGEFLMGWTRRETELFVADGHEQPVTRVTISQGFWMGKYEVKQGQWKAVMGSNPSRFKDCGPECPVENVSWNDAQKFIRGRNAAVGEERYRLPTEAEWEYAARAMSRTGTPAGDLDIVGIHNAPVLDGIAWYGGNSGVSYEGGEGCLHWPEKQYASSRCGTHPVGQKAPNAWGLHDMLGNVWEWVDDWHGDYPGGSLTDPRGPVRATRGRVVRGGGWSFAAVHCQVSVRSSNWPNDRAKYIGFRLLKTE